MTKPANPQRTVGTPTVIALCLALTPAAAHADSYANARFGYTVWYPQSLLVREPEADNSDGRWFHAVHGAGKMGVWGALRQMDFEPTPLSIAREYEADCHGARPTYQVVKPRLIAFSCTRGDGIVLYQETLIRADGVLATVRFEYPFAERATWDPVVTQVVRAFSAGRPGDGAQMRD